ncbi:MAG: SatD family protein [Anaerolineae bacterium]|nr:MAG: SatD family protein [Anaerolineae bacterium]
MVKHSNYTAVIGDVVGSRKAGDRSGLQDRLGGGLRDVNTAFDVTIAAEFVLTVGDEFQGLLSSASALDLILATLRTHAFPAELRFGVGVGPLETALRSQAIGMDGRCFHNARQAIERAAERRTPVEVQAEGPKAPFEIYSLLYGVIRSRWTTRQREVVDLSASGLEGREVAEYLSITPSAVSQHLRAAGAKELRAATVEWRSQIELATLREA